MSDIPKSEKPMQQPNEDLSKAMDQLSVTTDNSRNNSQMSEASELSIYEKTFAKSDKTDGILVVDGNKLHVNKALLSYHSNFFKTLFNSEFKEKSMEEIEIKGVEFEDFATLLSLVQIKPIEPKKDKWEKLLELADRFLLQAAKHYVELFICSTDESKYEKLRIAEKYDLNRLFEHALALHTSEWDFVQINEWGDKFSDRTKSKLFDKLVHLVRRNL
ncbi:unnamed protein product [Caenorhabditis brenneri]